MIFYKIYVTSVIIILLVYKSLVMDIIYSPDNLMDPPNYLILECSKYSETIHILIALIHPNHIKCLLPKMIILLLVDPLMVISSHGIHMMVYLLNKFRLVIHLLLLVYIIITLICSMLLIIMGIFSDSIDRHVYIHII